MVGSSILVVDDLPNNLRVLNDILTAEGYHVRASISGKLALKTAKNTPPDLIMLDINMPEMDGFETCAQLKSSQDTVNIPVIFLTARTATEDIVKGFELGAVDYVTKPFNSAELLARVNTQLALRRAEQEKEKLIEKLQYTLAEVKTLRGILPICSYCKNIRNDKGYFEQIEHYIHTHSGVDFSHTICPTCMEEHYPED